VLYDVHIDALACVLSSRYAMLCYHLLHCWKVLPRIRGGGRTTQPVELLNSFYIILEFVLLTLY